MQTERKAALGATILVVLLVRNAVADPTVQQAQEALQGRFPHSLYLGEQATERFLNSLAASGKIKVFYIPEGITEIAAVLPEFASEWPHPTNFVDIDAPCTAMSSSVEGAE